MHGTQVSVERGEGLHCSLQIEVPAAQVAAAVEKELRSLAGRTNIKGFRPGKVPLNVIRQRYGDSAQQEACENLVRETFSAALRDNGLKPAVQPEIELLAIPSPSEDLSYRARFELFPEVPPCRYEDLRVERLVCTVGDEEVEDALRRMLRQGGAWEESDEPAAAGDRVVFDYRGEVEGGEAETEQPAQTDEPVEDGEQSDGRSEGSSSPLSGSQIKLDLYEADPDAVEREETSEETSQVETFGAPLFVRVLTGMRPGESKSFSALLPENYYRPSERGLTANFEVTLTSVFKSNPAQLDAPFLASIGFAEKSEQDLREALRNQLQREVDSAAMQKVKSRLFEGLLEQYSEVPLPEVLVEEELRGDPQVGHEYRQALEEDEQGQQDAEKLSVLAKRPEFARARSRARHKARLGLVVSELIQQEQIKPDEGRVVAAIEAAAARYPDPKAVQAQYYRNQQLLDSVARATLEDQLVELLVKRSQVTEVTATSAQVRAREPSFFDTLPQDLPATEEQDQRQDQRDEGPVEGLEDASSSGPTSAAGDDGSQTGVFSRLRRWAKGKPEQPEKASQ